MCIFVCAVAAAAAAVVDATVNAGAVLCSCIAVFLLTCEVAVFLSC